MGIWDSLSGYIKCRVVSASLNEFFDRATENGSVHSVEYLDELTATFWVPRSNLQVLFKTAELRGDILTVIKKTGLFWSGINFLKRPVLITGVLLLVFLTFYLPTRIFFVGVDGNKGVSVAQILDVSQKCGVRFGAPRKLVRSEQVKNALLQKLPQLQWACVNTRGCVAVISVRERNSVDCDLAPGVCDIAAARDGIITEMTVENGTPLCQIGQAVKKGQTLISGYTDLGLVVKAGRAEGEVFAETQRQLTVMTPTEYTAKKEITAIENRYSLLIGKKLINFQKDSGISPVGCGRMYVESYATLPGGFRLPVAVVLERITYYEEAAQTAGKDELSWLNNAGEAITKSNMIAGEITTSNSFVHVLDDTAILRGMYRCREMIGRIHNEEIFTEYGKRD
jgi:sporulation protein YqfD